MWQVYKGLYVASRVGALHDRHKSLDTYYIPTLSVGYSW